jgi:hypothetical protein
MDAPAPTRTSTWVRSAIIGGLLLCASMVAIVQKTSVASEFHHVEARKLRDDVSATLVTAVAGSRRLVTETDAKSEYLGFFRDALLNLHYNFHRDYKDGARWPPNSAAVSMAGQRR